MEGKPKATVTNLAEFARQKREKEAGQTSENFKTISNLVRPALETPEAKKRFPGLEAEELLKVFTEGIIMMQEDHVQHLQNYDLIAADTSDEDLVQGIKNAVRLGMNAQTAPQYVAYAERIFEILKVPALSL